MKLDLICTRDIVANVYSHLMSVPHLGLAIRSFGDECQRKDENNKLAKHPDHYELWHVGTFDDTTCEFEIFDAQTRRRIAVGATYRNAS